ncbi:MAG TPA: hypothetical protein VNU72_11665 [Puia sp.]|jgi:hypothetical protein|nr:hypothetical protein [Puia sp.]
MKRNSAKQLLLIAVFAVLAIASQAQVFVNNDSAFKVGTPNTGRIWGYAFGDLYYKAHSDTLNRGGNNQYTGIPQSRNAFQFRRIYLGYDYNFNKKFSAELLLAAEDNFPAYNPPSSAVASGDQLLNNKLTFFIKLANVRIKNIWKGTDLVIGEQATPSFPMISEKVWNYRSIERTIADIRRTPSYDFGAGLNGVFDPSTKNFGYNLLVANGTSDKPDANNFKWFYGDVYGWFFDKKLVVDFYADYQRLNWQPGWHHDRQMIKGYVAYTTQPITIGVEGFINNMPMDTKASKIGGGADTIATKATGISFYVHGDIVPNTLRFFARLDLYNPNKNVDNSKYSAYAGISSPNGYMSPGYKMTYSPNTGAPTGATSTGDPTSKETFITFGLDYMPFRDIHLEPNLWLNSYSSQLAAGTQSGSDVVLRLTFYYVFGKKYANSWTQL